MQKLLRWLILSLAGIILTLLFASTSSFAATNPILIPGQDDTPASEQILVKFKPGIPQAVKERVHVQNDAQVIDAIPEIGIEVVKVAKGKAREKVANYSRNPHVEFAEPDYIARAVFIPDDPYFEKQWGMAKIQAPDAWKVTKGSREVKIAILDSGIDQDHEDLRTQIVANVDFTPSKTVDDKFGHGTHVAGIAAAATNNGKGVAGVGFKCSLMNVKVLGDDGSGYYSWLAKGIIWATKNGAKVINISAGSNRPSKVLEKAINYAWSQGVVLVAAAGNDNSSAPFYPAFYTNCIAVGATDENDSRAFFSNYGPWVDIAAPGLNIFSTTPNHDNYIHNYGIALGYDYLSGTSMASPHVAGIAALVWAKYPGLSNAEVRKRIETGADPAEGFDPPIGRANAYKALR
ncbi:S8 family peptidase [Neomoorella mulderi]|uniref:Thermophilic serine proteinase n=1 Tax=Moorella mulderi DSM 14980 TaxID=1122241 RepID=A0A151AZ07_9FIRM|nr:S8 family peptidase [Moorella mulderi]KYH32894.1 thermophilic serine proteinase precursor [Moorella mulderi DSM 14980]